MLYMTTIQGVRMVVLETRNVEELLKGHPIHTPDNQVLIAWTPDLPWLAERIVGSGGGGLEIGKLIDAARGRAENPTAGDPNEPMRTHKFKG